MTVFDLVVVAVIAISTLLALLRGIVREVIALVSWIAALILAFRYAGDVAGLFTGVNVSPAVMQVIAFAVVFIVVLIAGGLIAVTLSRAVRAVGLGPVDRLLGGAFGLVRGVVAVLLGILVCGLTSLPRNEWWQNATLAAPLVAAALEFRDWLPPAWAGRLDYPADSPTGRGSGTRVELPCIGRADQCVES